MVWKKFVKFRRAAGAPRTHSDELLSHLAKAVQIADLHSHSPGAIPNCLHSTFPRRWKTGASGVVRVRFALLLFIYFFHAGANLLNGPLQTCSPFNSSLFCVDADCSFTRRCYKRHVSYIGGVQQHSFHRRLPVSCKSFSQLPRERVILPGSCIAYALNHMNYTMHRVATGHYGVSPARSQSGCCSPDKVQQPLPKSCKATCIVSARACMTFFSISAP